MDSCRADEILKAVWPEWTITGDRIGKGSFSNVYEIGRKDFGGEYRAALKVIRIPDEEELEEMKARHLTDEQIAETLKNQVQDYSAEIRMMYSVKNEANVVSIEDYKAYQAPDETAWYILIRMELLTPLLKKMQEEEPDEKEIIRIGIDISTALEVCRNRNIVHRDVAPKNIFVNEQGRYKLGDFGVARTIERSTRVTKAGTPNYMSPEVAKAMLLRSDIDAAARADIYSLGLVLYELGNGHRLPFIRDNYSGKDRYDAYQRRMAGEKIPPPEKVSEGLQRVILKACAYLPEDRYRNAREMKEALEKIGKPSDESIPAPHPEKPEKGDGKSGGKDSGQRRKKIAIIGWIAVLALVITGLFFWKPWSAGTGGKTGEHPAAAGTLPTAAPGEAEKVSAPETLPTEAAVREEEAGSAAEAPPTAAATREEETGSAAEAPPTAAATREEEAGSVAEAPPTAAATREEEAVSAPETLPTAAATREEEAGSAAEASPVLTTAAEPTPEPTPEPVPDPAVPMPEPGDVNGDGKVDLKDFTGMMRYLLDPDQEVISGSGDLNGDGVADIKDISCLEELILSQESGL